MFKKFFVMVVVVMIMAMSSTSVLAMPTYYCDTPEGREQRRALSILQLKYDFAEVIYEEEEFYDGIVEVVFDENTNLYTLTATWTINKENSVEMCYTFFDDDYEIGSTRTGYLWINGESAATQIGESDPVWSEYGQQFEEYFIF